MEGDNVEIRGMSIPEAEEELLKDIPDNKVKEFFLYHFTLLHHRWVQIGDYSYGMYKADVRFCPFIARSGTKRIHLHVRAANKLDYTNRAITSR